MQFFSSSSFYFSDRGEMEGKRYLNELRILGAEEIKTLANTLIENSRRVQDAIAAVRDGEHTFENTLKALADDQAIMATQGTNCSFPSYVSPNKEIRDASTDANVQLETFQIESEMREDVYHAILKFRDTKPTLDPQAQRLLDKTIEDFERNGLGLPADKREQLMKLKKRIAELCINFQKNINEDTTALEFTKEELEGLPEDFLENLKKSEDGQRLVVTLKYPELFPVMRQARRAQTRTRLEFAESTQCMDQNIPILEEVIRLRHEAAQLLGFETHADYILKIRMAKNSRNVVNFLSDLRQKLIPFGERELQTLLNLKRAEKAKQGDEASFDGRINAWDFRYYHRLLLETEYQVNDDLIKEYFPIDVVTKALLDIYQRVLGLRFEEVKDVVVWHEDVRMFGVYDLETDAFMGHFYLDLHPREGKYTHAAAFPLQPTYIKPDATRQYPSAAMVANFTKPGKDRPSLLKHNEVVTYFHEFGHIMHNICSTVNYSRFSGTSVERDFVEAPSQMLENWCWEKEILALLSGHFKDPSKHLPEDVVEKMVAAKNVDTGLLNLRQIFFGTFDNVVHSSASADTTTLWKTLKKEVSLVETTPGTNGAATFGHLVGGYDAQYYGYLYSEVFSADMFSVFKEQGILDGAVGRRYRDLILARGGSVDSFDSLVQFLGREPTQEAFLHHLGLLPPKDH